MLIIIELVSRNKQTERCMKAKFEGELGIYNIYDNHNINLKKKMVSDGESAQQYISVPAVPRGTKHEDGTLVLNRFSTIVTRGHDFPGAQVCRPFIALSLVMKCVLILHEITHETYL